jgi:hypothetical protein
MKRLLTQMLSLAGPVAIVAMLATPALAVGTKVIESTGPVRLNACEAFPERYVISRDGHMYRFGDVPFLQANANNQMVTGMHLGANFTNTSEKAADMIQVRYIGIDTFENVNTKVELRTFTGTFGAKMTIDRMKQGYGMSTDPVWSKNDSLQRIECSVNAVHFADGSIWKNDG